MDGQTDILKGVWKGRYTSRWMDRLTYIQVDRQTDILKGVWKGRYTHRWIDGQTDTN